RSRVHPLRVGEARAYRRNRTRRQARAARPRPGRPVDRRRWQQIGAGSRVKQAAPPPARPALNEATQDSAAGSKEYPDDLILAFAEIVRRPTWPDSPREALAYGYGRMSLNALARPDLPFAATDMHLARLARAVRAGRLSFKNSDSLLSSIDRAL